MDRKEKVYLYTQQINAVHPEFFQSLSKWANSLVNIKRYPLGELGKLREVIINGLLVNAGGDFFPVLPEVPEFARNKNIEGFVKERLTILDSQIRRVQDKIAKANEKEATRKKLFTNLFENYPWVAKKITSSTVKNYSDSTLEDALSKIEEYLFFEKEPSAVKDYESRISEIKNELKKRLSELEPTVEETETTLIEGADDELAKTEGLKSKVVNYKWYILGGVALIGGIILLTRRGGNK